MSITGYFVDLAMNMYEGNVSQPNLLVHTDGQNADIPDYQSGLDSALGVHFGDSDDELPNNDGFGDVQTEGN